MGKEKTTAWARLATTRAGRVALVASDAGLVLSTLPGRADVDGVGMPDGAGRDDHDGQVRVSQRSRSWRNRAPARAARSANVPGPVARLLDAAEEALVSYYARWPEHPGERLGSLWDGLLRLPVDLNGLPSFTRTVLHLLRRIPPGQVVTYGDLAARAGSPRAARAVGSVMARNPLPIILPCHRIIASDGSLGGFSGETKGEALAFKESLLRYEGWTLG